MHLLCFKVIISRAFIPAVTMHVEPVCSEMCILQAEFFFNTDQTTLIAGNEPFQKMVTCSHLLDVVVYETQIQTKKIWFHGQVAAQGGWTVYKMTHSKREITYTSWSDIPFH